MNKMNKIRVARAPEIKLSVTEEITGMHPGRVLTVEELEAMCQLLEIQETHRWVNQELADRLLEKLRWNLCKYFSIKSGGQIEDDIRFLLEYEVPFEGIIRSLDNRGLVSSKALAKIFVTEILKE
jgi:hypothetical protein